MPPSGRQRWTRSGGGYPPPTVSRDGSVHAGERQHLRPLSLGQPAPDSIRLVHLKGVSSTRRHGRTFETDGLGLRLTPGPRRTAFALGVEEERARHPAAGCVQLPVPEVGIRAGKAPGVRHVDPLRCEFGGDRICLDPISKRPTEPGIWARSVARQDQPGGYRPRPTNPGDLPRWSRIRADPGAVDDQTLDPFSARDKTLIMIFVDLDDGALPEHWAVHSKIERVSRCGVAHTRIRGPFGVGRWPVVFLRLLSALGVATDAHFCPKNPLWGTYGRTAESQGSGGSAALKTSPSITSAGGTT